MKKNLIALLIASLFCKLSIVDGDAGGDGADPAGAAASGGADNDKGGDKAELSIGEELAANMEIGEKGEDSNELSAAAKRLASARKPKAPIDKIDDETLKESERVAKANEAKAKREAELAKMPEADRAKAIEEDKKKEQTEREAAEAAKLEAPVNWPAADREMFAKQTPEAKKFLLNRHKAMETDYMKKTQEIAPHRAFLGTMDELFKPYEQEMRESGVTREQAVRELVGMHARLKRDPVEGLKYIAEISGIDIKTLATASSADPAADSPVVRELKQQLATMSNELKGLKGASSEQATNAHLQTVTQFAEEKDAQGQLLRPYFDDVALDVAAQIRIAKSKNPPETLTLQDAYDRAVHANPTTRAKVLQAADAKRKAAEEADRKKRADAAKLAAGGNISGEGSASSVSLKSDGTVRGDLEAAFADVGDRV